MSDRDQEPSTDDPDTSTDFVDGLDDEDKWEVLNAQIDTSLRLYTQTIRFLQILLTLLGLAFTGVAVFGPSAVASVLMLPPIEGPTIPEVVSLTALFLIIAYHGIFGIMYALALLFLPAMRLSMGLDIYPVVGDQTTLEAGKKEWIRSNKNMTAQLENNLSHGYSFLFLLLAHLFIAFLIYHGLKYEYFTLLYGLGFSLGYIVMAPVWSELRDEEDMGEFSEEAPLTQTWQIIKRSYKQAKAEADTRRGAWIILAKNDPRLLGLLPHLLFWSNFLFSLFSDPSRFQ